MADLDKALAVFLQQQRPVLFAGAGVGKRVGYPDWHEFIQHLANVADDFDDQTSATLIRERLKTGNLIGAATVYTSSDLIPPGEKLKGLQRPFSQLPPPKETRKLVPLVSLPFTGVLTTNFDRSLHAAANDAGRRPIHVERLDGTFKIATYTPQFYIARLHGRAELPETIACDALEYRRLLEDSAYLDFLISTLRDRPCLFVGFSFKDPAIAHVLELYRQRVGPNFPESHIAFLPDGADELSRTLTGVNIRVITYRLAQGHRELWQAFNRAEDLLRQAASSSPHRPAEPRNLITPATGTQRFIAFAYSQLKTLSTRQGLSKIVLDGVVVAVVAESDNEVTRIQIEESLRRALGITEQESKELASDSIARLLLQERLRQTSDGFLATDNFASALQNDLAGLAEHVIDRAFVREGMVVPAGLKSDLANVLERLFLTRAWDLAAHFAGAATGYASDIAATAARIVEEEVTLTPSARAAVTGALLDLFDAPEDRETPLLTNISRAAFGLQLVLSTPRQALFQRSVLPNRIYLDSNILMPAIAPGHPLRPVYTDAVERFAKAAGDVGIDFEVLVGEHFLNEIISHRRRAFDLVDDLELEKPQELVRHIAFYSGVNTNVFVGAYGGRVGRLNEFIGFGDFMGQIAPYETEAELAVYLEARGIQTVGMRFLEGEGGQLYTLYLNGLKSAYSKSHSRRAYEKAPILVEHEAQQLVQLAIDENVGYRSIFVTADRVLRRALNDDARLKGISAQTVSQLGLIALVDIMVGLESDPRSWARLVWASPQTDEEEALFEYFVRLGLRHYQEGVAMEMQEAARAAAHDAVSELDRSGLDLFGRDPKDVSRVAKFLDRFEDKFFQNWKEAQMSQGRK